MKQNTLKEFMKVRGGNALTKIQASMFGLEYSQLKNNWRKRFKDLSVTDEVWERLLATVEHSEQPIQKESNGYLYVIRNEENIWKIGISEDVTSRISNLQTASPSKLTLLATYKSYTPVYNLEQKVHKKLRKHNIRGEWFDGNKITLNDIEVLIGAKGLPGTKGEVSRRIF